MQLDRYDYTIGGLHAWQEVPTNAQFDPATLTAAQQDALGISPATTQKMTAAARSRPATADKTWKTAAPGLCTVSGAVGNQNHPAPRSPGPAATPDGTRTAANSYNWSGLEANGNTSANLQAYAYSEIDSEWFEPHSSEACSSPSQDRNVMWVGIGGDSNAQSGAGLVQDGTGQANGSQWSWFEWLYHYPTNYDTTETHTTLVPHDGDQMKAETQFDPPGHPANVVYFTVQDLTTFTEWHTYVDFSSSSGNFPAFQPESAEAISERSTLPNGKFSQYRKYDQYGVGFINVEVHELYRNSTNYIETFPSDTITMRGKNGLLLSSVDSYAPGTGGDDRFTTHWKACGVVE